MQRQLKKEVKIGSIKIGGTNPIAVQTMLNVPVKDIAGNVAQAERVAKAGCQIVRVTVPTPADAAVVAAIKEKVDIPVVADIHFDYRAALAALDAGADKIRINPGNIGDDDRVKAVADACNARNVPIRIGVNGGSLEKHILAKYGAPVPEAMVESAMYHVRLLQKYDFDNIVISIKSSNVPRMMAAYRLLAGQTDYPLHVGVTEAGGNRMGLIKSGMGIGGLLMEGIGDTLRVSLTDEPENEVYAGYDILRAAGYAVAGPEIISCPTCGRTQYPMIEIANEVEARLRDEGFKKPLKIAIMGCVVNGPGEAREADLGVTGGKDPDNRRTYPWGHEDLDLLSWTKALTRLRTAHDALQTGRFIPLYADGDVFAFARVIEGGRDVFGKPAEDGFFIIAMNRNPSALRTISIYTDGLAYGKLTNALHPRMTPVTTVNSRLTLTLPPLKVVILQGKEAGTKRAGVLLHPTSLPAACGNGVLGPAAYRFVDFLKAAGQRVWQILPLTPPLMGDSPYLSESAFAGNEALISLEVLRDWGWLRQEALDDFLAQGQKTASWHSLAAYKAKILWDMSHDPDLTIPWEPFWAFCEKNAYWLDDYALFRAVRDFFGGRCWTEWPEDIRHHSREALAQYGRELAGAVSHVKFMQYIFSRQWHDVRAYAAKNGVSVLGDVPMFVAHNSADCWAHQDQFDLDEMGNPSSVAGVPPDYFSADGQLWGNPLYDYQAMAADNYQWWTDRFRRMMDLVDEVRVDHFRGFAAYWAVPAGSETAKSGAWKEGPGLDLFRAVYQKIGRLRLVAEDLGVITDDVCTLKDALHLPGMKVIQFHLKDRADGRLAFDTEPDCIAYTGTHDNNTIRGWYEDDLTPSQQLHVRQMLGLSDEAAPQEIVGALIAYTCRRRAETVIIPMQDLLALPSSGRMNTPGVAEGNWHWQLKDGQLTFDIARWLAKVCRESGR